MGFGLGIFFGCSGAGLLIHAIGEMFSEKRHEGIK